eukprot:GHVN01101039.1.p1 GENE.GHVN01101039.1~~GHVN01101039.1.p1  ORF type:complete len:178 (+),score=4.41 GHVN01101039.1:3-536(+)
MGLAQVFGVALSMLSVLPTSNNWLLKPLTCPLAPVLMFSWPIRHVYPLSPLSLRILFPSSRHAAPSSVSTVSCPVSLNFSKGDCSSILNFSSTNCPFITVLILSGKPTPTLSIFSPSPSALSSLLSRLHPLNLNTFRLPTNVSYATLTVFHLCFVDSLIVHLYNISTPLLNICAHSH